MRALEPRSQINHGPCWTLQATPTHHAIAPHIWSRYLKRDAAVHNARFRCLVYLLGNWVYKPYELTAATQKTTLGVPTDPGMDYRNLQSDPGLDI